MDHPWTQTELIAVRDRTGLAEIEFFESIESTNDWVLERLRAGSLPLPHLALAHRQSRGRGRGAHRWWSAEGGLTLSLTIAPPTDASGPRVPLAAGLAVADVVDGTLAASPGRVSLKWPNDVLLDGRKVAGILVEAVPLRGAAVVGIGLNVNQDMDLAPEDLRASATSLFQASGITFGLPEMLVQLIDRLSHEFRRLSNSDPGWSRDFDRRCWLRGRIVTIRTGDRRVVGRCEGIDERGWLVLRTERGSEAISAGSIEATLDPGL